MEGNKRKLIAPILIIGVVLVAVATCFALGAINKKDDSESGKKEEPIVVTPPEPKITGYSAKYLFVGTTFWGRNTNKSSRASELGVNYPFSKLDTLDRESYQAWVGGLECPVTDSGHNYAEEDKIFKFNCDPDYLPVAAKYFTAFLLGNNHAGNQGLEGMRTTRKYLEENNIQYFGTPKRTASDPKDTEYNNDEADISNCSIVVMPVIASYDNNETSELKFPFGFCSAHGVYGVPGDDFLQNIANYSKVVPTIAMPHMGVEYKKTHDTLRQNLYHKIIDLGAESVIADHPHTVQDSEAYNGKLIVYSMGNFMFDQTFNAEVPRSAAIEANVTISADSSDLKKWNELGESCLSDKTSCFTKITNANLSKPTVSWNYNYHATTSAGDRITRLANEADQSSIGQRLNWAATVSGLAK